MAKLLLRIYRYLFAKSAFQRLNTQLFHLSLRGLGILNYENDKISGEKFFLDKILPKILNVKNPILFDIGANQGNYSKLLVENFPEATIHAFEPHPVSFEIMCKNLTFPNVKMHNLALGEQSGEFNLYDRSDISGSEHASLYKGVISELHKQTILTFQITVETLDKFTNQHGIKDIDFLKIDTEGHELSVLKGASNLLLSGSIRCIQFEFNEMNIMSRVFFRDFKEILNNYKLFRLLPNSLLSLGDNPLETELFGYQNIIALKKDIIL